MTFVLATANVHKTDEMRAVLEPLGFELLARPSDVPDVLESEVTLEDNALLKARALVAATSHAAIADDTGLFAAALDGRPGVFSARYAGQNASDDENVAKLLLEMKSIPEDARDAHFRTVVCVAYPSGESLCVEGVLKGRITPERRGRGGFGYDSVFEPEGAQGRTLAELTMAQKNVLSHRARALDALVTKLQTSS